METGLWHRFQAEKLRGTAAEWDKAALNEGLFHLKTAYKRLAHQQRVLAAHHDDAAIALRAKVKTA